MHGLNPFFEMMTPSVRYVAVLLSVCAGVIASQALITGAYTMVSEATRLNWMPHLQVRYPARTRGQLYIPVVNAVLCVSTLLVLAMFRDSEHISAAYGPALTVTMITTTILLAVYIWHDGKRVGAVVFTVVFPGHPVPVLLRFDGEVPARWLVHHAADIGDSADYVHVERRHEAGTRATPAYAARRLRAGSEAAS